LRGCGRAVEVVGQGRLTALELPAQRPECGEAADRFQPLLGAQQVDLDVRTAAVGAAQVAGVEHGCLHLEWMQPPQAVSGKTPGESHVARTEHALTPRAEGAPAIRRAGRARTTTSGRRAGRPRS